MCIHICIQIYSLRLYELDTDLLQKIIRIPELRRTTRDGNEQKTGCGNMRMMNDVFNDTVEPKNAQTPMQATTLDRQADTATRYR